MLKRNIFIPAIWLLVLLFWALPVFAQVNTAWVRRYDGPVGLTDQANDIAIDSSGNVYVTGLSNGGGTSYDYTTIKYDGFGNELWVRRYNGSGNDFDNARAIAVDDSGNVYVTGNAWLDETRWDYATIKYDLNGTQLWVSTYNEPGLGNEFGQDIALDDVNNVYVTGHSQADYATVKYDQNGNEHWVVRYSGPNDSADYAQALAVDDSGYVYVIGQSGGIGTGPDYATIKHYPNGDTAWVGRYDGTGNDEDKGLAIAVDGSGNVYVTGYSTGSGTDYDYATVKYLPNGDTAWVRRYNGSGNSMDIGLAIAVDNSGNAHVTGYSVGSGTDRDYATIKYYPDGDTAWVRRYNGPVNGYDGAWSIAVDDSGNVYANGCSMGSGTGFDYATVKYDPNGEELWVTRYNGAGNGTDVTSAIAVDDSGNVYVTGWSWGSGTEHDYVTIKYVQSGYLRGDANGDGIIDLGDLVYLIGYLYKGGPAPDPMWAGDCNCDGIVNVGDVVYLVNYLYRGGDPPGCP